MAIYRKFNNLCERIYWSYANLCMLHFALKANKHGYDKQCYMVRARMYKDFCSGTISPKSMFVEHKLKMNVAQQCAYCKEKGAEVKYSIDHILPRNRGGDDCGDNLINVCISCNSSKRDNDLLEWYVQKRWVIDPWLLRVYLKLVLDYCKENDLLQKQKDELDYSQIPFNPDFLPQWLPAPKDYESDSFENFI